jgi:acetoin:2,6-dichlorophenolindophenol oxidoreductase subunit beta
LPEIRYVDAIRAALADSLADDPSVIILGEDISVGGPFGATRGLIEDHGLWRVRDTPISEAAVMGLGVGAALTGLRPIVEIMFIDFITLAMDQLVNHAAKLRYMSGGALSVPLTVRAQFGASGGFGAHHSQSLEAWFAHVPGLRVVAPGSPADAYASLRAAIRADDPVLVLEHRGLYWTRGPDAPVADPWTSTMIRPGRDATVVAWSRMARTALAAAELLARDGIELEVIDARSLSPIDLEPIVASVRRTHRAVVATESVVQAGLSAEISAALTEAAFEALEAPVARVGAPFVPPPAGPELEARFVPSAERIADVIHGLVGGGREGSKGSRRRPTRPKDRP